MTHHLQGSLNKINIDFLLQTTEARKQWDNIFKVFKEKNCQSRILNAAKLSFKNESEFKMLRGKQKLRKFVARKPCFTSNNKGCSPS